MKTQVSDAGCAALASALNGGALQALEDLDLARIPASAAAKAAVGRAGFATGGRRGGRVGVMCGRGAPRQGSPVHA